MAGQAAISDVISRISDLSVAIATNGELADIVIRGANDPGNPTPAE